MDTARKLDVLKDTYAGTPEFDQVLDELLDVAISEFRLRLERYERDLSEFERRHGRPSGVFYKQFTAGELGDAMDFFEWASVYELRQDVLDKLHHPELASHPHHVHQGREAIPLEHAPVTAPEVLAALPTEFLP